VLGVSRTGIPVTPRLIRPHRPFIVSRTSWGCSTSPSATGCTTCCTPPTPALGLNRRVLRTVALLSALLKFGLSTVWTAPPHVIQPKGLLREAYRTLKADVAAMVRMVDMIRCHGAVSKVIVVSL
jgi:hypothetical protein